MDKEEDDRQKADKKLKTYLREQTNNLKKREKEKEDKDALEDKKLVEVRATNERKRIYQRMNEQAFELKFYDDL